MLIEHGNYFMLQTIVIKLSKQDKELQAIKEQVKLLQIHQKEPLSDVKEPIDSLSGSSIKNAYIANL